jgi:Triosephosphate isomerase
MNLPATTSGALLPLTLPAALDGRAGTNRACGANRQIAADTDLEAVRLWLAAYAGSLHTLRSYCKEAVRLLVGATRGLGKPLSSAPVRSSDAPRRRRKCTRSCARLVAKSAALAEVPLLYGGSAKPENAEALFRQADIDGGLIGGASLKGRDFLAICVAAQAASASR